MNDARVHLLVRTASIEIHSTSVKTKKNDIVSMQKIKKELERVKEKESNHLKCCSGSIGGVIAKKKKNKNQREFKAVHFR